MATRKTKATQEQRPKTVSPRKQSADGSAPIAAMSGTVSTSSVAAAAAPLRSAMPTEDEIRERAYHLYLQRGCGPGCDVDDWLVAERQLSASRAAP